MNPIHVLLFVPMLMCASNARAERREFDVSVDVRVDSAGNVTSADVIADITPESEATVIGLVRQWKFRIGTRDGIPSHVDTTVLAHVVADFSRDQPPLVSATYIAHGPRYLKQVPPSYPSRATRIRAQGEIVVNVAFAADGTPRSLETHSAHVHGGKRAARLLSEAAIDAIRQWRVQPERVDDVAIGARVLIPMKFSIDSARPAELETVIAPPAGQETVTTGLQEEGRSTRVLALENGTGLELISDSAKI